LFGIIIIIDLDCIYAFKQEVEMKKENKRVQKGLVAGIVVVLAIVLGIIGFASGQQDKAQQSGEVNGIVFSEDQRYFADIEMKDHGVITVELDYATAPITVRNFVTLAEDGFYDGLTFHRIMNGFMMQGGDPQANGSGGSGKTIIGEFSANGHKNDLSHTRGVISMARSKTNNSASSQFFIVHEDSLFLDGQYAAFGYVTEGMEIVDTICSEAKPVDGNGTIPAEAQPVMTSVKIRIESKDAAAE
jgi:peptidyl-prolyl cis-trans isomerase B (cyclophilin B)